MARKKARQKRHKKVKTACPFPKEVFHKAHNILNVVTVSSEDFILAVCELMTYARDGASPHYIGKLEQALANQQAVEELKKLLDAKHYGGEE